MPLAGHLVTRIGPRRALLVGAAGITTALVLMTIGLSGSLPWLAGAGLGLYGLGISQWDVAMNVAGAELERRSHHPLLPQLHASLSLGTIIGSTAGVLAAAANVSVVTQLIVTTVLVVACVSPAARRLPRIPSLAAGATAGARPDSVSATPVSLTSAWREPRTVLIGVTVLAFALCEGIAGNWLALALVDAHHNTEALAAFGYALFVIALTLGRATGSALINRLGRITTLRLLALAVIVGVLLVVYTTPLVFVLLGCILWGLGSALGFPIGMSAATDDPIGASIRVSVVSWIGYGAFFAGPPLIGYLASVFGILTALLSVAVAAVVAVATAISVRVPRALPT